MDRHWDNHSEAWVANPTQSLKTIVLPGRATGIHKITGRLSLLVLWWCGFIFNVRSNQLGVSCSYVWVGGEHTLFCPIWTGFRLLLLATVYHAEHMVEKREGIATDSYASGIHTWTVTLHWLLSIHLCGSFSPSYCWDSRRAPNDTSGKSFWLLEKIAPHQAIAMAFTDLSKEASFETKLGFLYTKITSLLTVIVYLRQLVYSLVLGGVPKFRHRRIMQNC